MPHVLADERGTVTIPDATMAQIVLRAAETVDGARVRRARRGLELALTDGSARVELELVARYGSVLPRLGRDVQGAVRDALAGMCGLDAEVDVSIEELE